MGLIVMMSVTPAQFPKKHRYQSPTTTKPIVETPKKKEITFKVVDLNKPSPSALENFNKSISDIIRKSL